MVGRPRRRHPQARPRWWSRRPARSECPPTTSCVYATIPWSSLRAPLSFPVHGCRLRRTGRSRRNRLPVALVKRSAGVAPGGTTPRLIPERPLASHMTLTDLHPVQETSPGSLLFQLLGSAHSVTHRLAETLSGLGLSAAGLDLLPQLPDARKPPPLADLGDRRGDTDPQDA